MSGTSKAIVDEFLACRRIAFVGVSRNKDDFSRALFREFRKHGYEMIPVHPATSEIEGIPAAATVEQISPPPEGVLVMTPGKESREIVEQCHRAGVKHVWLYKAVTAGSVTPEAVEACDQYGIHVVAGECPFMFLKGSGLVHTLHRGFRQLTGAYPR